MCYFALINIDEHPIMINFEERITQIFIKNGTYRI